MTRKVHCVNNNKIKHSFSTYHEPGTILILYIQYAFKASEKNLEFGLAPYVYTELGKAHCSVNK